MKRNDGTAERYVPGVGPNKPIRGTASWNTSIGRWIVVVPGLCRWLHDVWGADKAGGQVDIWLYPTVYTDGIVTWDAVAVSALDTHTGRGEHRTTWRAIVVDRIARNAATIRERSADGRDVHWQR